MNKRVFAGAMVVMALAVAAGQAQTMSGGAAAAMTATQMDPAKALDKQLSGVESEFVALAEAMPADKYGFAPSADYFKPGTKTEYTGVRTFAQQITHVTQANYHYYSQFAAAPPTVDVKAIGNLTSKDDVVKALKDSFAYGHAAIATITAQNAFQVVNAKSGATPALLAAGVVAHCFDHYGQMVEYARMNGVVPPASAR
jgi:uncharacterized damage-inducible protein DinB